MTEERARDRVESFIRDFHAAWQRSGSVPIPAFNPCTADPDATFDPLAWAQSQTPTDFAAWENELADLVDKHFTPGSRTGAEGALSGKPDHDPASERIVGVEVGPTRAEVHTVLPDVNSETYFTYRLVADRHDWRISRIVRTHAPAGTPLMAEAEVERLLAGMELVQDGEPVPAELAASTTALFNGRFEIIELGHLTTSGVLTAHDFGWVGFDVAPFHRRVPAGSYPVDLARDGHGRNVAVRVRLTAQEVVARVPAVRVGTGSVIGVDAGNVAILDFIALTSQGQGRIEEVYLDQAQAIGTTGAVFSLTGGPPEAVMVRSGDGDGAYPALWGLAADGSAVDLVVDFLVAIEEVSTTVTFPWAVGPGAHPAVLSHELEVLTEGDGIVFRYREHAGGTSLLGVRVLDSAGGPLSGRGGGTFIQGGVSERTWRPDGPIPDDAEIEVTLSRGYRHI